MKSVMTSRSQVTKDRAMPKASQFTLAESGSHKVHWIGLRENLQETMVFTIKYRVFLKFFPSSNSMKGVTI